MLAAFTASVITFHTSLSHSYAPVPALVQQLWVALVTAIDSLRLCAMFCVRGPGRSYIEFVWICSHDTVLTSTEPACLQAVLNTLFFHARHCGFEPYWDKTGHLQKHHENDIFTPCRIPIPRNYSMDLLHGFIPRICSMVKNTIKQGPSHLQDQNSLLIQCKIVVGITNEPFLVHPSAP